MFPYIFVQKDHDTYHFVKFLGGDLSKSLHCMQTHVIEARCSPCCAVFAVRKTAGDCFREIDKKP